MEATETNMAENGTLGCESGDIQSNLCNAQNNRPEVTPAPCRASNDKESDEESSDEEVVAPGYPEVDPGVTERRVAIIKRLLESFNLEETIDKYRCLDPRDFSSHEADFSLNSASANSRVKQRLERLMGTDVVKLNDKKYMLKLEKNIQLEYEAAMMKKEAERVSIEQMRMRRLAVQGLTSEDYDDMGNLKNRKSRRRKKVTYEDEAGEDLKNIVAKERQPVHHTRYQEIRGQASRDLTENREDTDSRNEEVSPKAITSPEDAEEDASQGKSPRPPRERYEPPLVKEMKEEETVAGLYRLAQRIVL